MKLKLCKAWIVKLDADELSSKTISNLYNDLEQLYKSKNTDKNTDKLCIFTDAKEANELSKELENIPNNKLYVFSDGNVHYFTAFLLS